MEDRESVVVSALARAAIYRAVSLGFQTPSDAVLRELRVCEGFPPLVDAVRCLAADGGGELPTAVERLQLAARDGGPADTDYWRVFGHTTRGRVCACETEYGDDNKFQQPQQLADISGYYLAFGLTPPSASDVRQDHVACECEFMAFLSLKEALFVEAGDSIADGADTLEATRRAQHTFLRDHLGYFGRAFASRLTVEDCGPYYNAWGLVLRRFLDAECLRVGVQGGPSELIVREELTDDAVMACGTEDQLIQIQRHP